MSDRNHTTPVPAILTDPWDWDDERPGHFRVDDDGQRILMMCPCGCGAFMHLPIHTNGKIDHHWLWDGNREQPTLSPSIRDLSGCHFHGFLQQGVWTFCGDSGK